MEDIIGSSYFDHGFTGTKDFGAPSKVDENFTKLNVLIDTYKQNATEQINRLLLFDPGRLGQNLDKVEIPNFQEQYGTQIEQNLNKLIDNLSMLQTKLQQYQEFIDNLDKDTTEQYNSIKQQMKELMANSYKDFNDAISKFSLNDSNIDDIKKLASKLISGKLDIQISSNSNGDLVEVYIKNLLKDIKREFDNMYQKELQDLQDDIFKSGFDLPSSYVTELRQNITYKISEERLKTQREVNEQAATFVKELVAYGIKGIELLKDLDHEQFERAIERLKISFEEIKLQAYLMEEFLKFQTTIMDMKYKAVDTYIKIISEISKNILDIEKIMLDIGNTELQMAMGNLQIELHKANFLDKYIGDKTKLKLESVKEGASLSATILAGALNALNVSASISARNTFNESHNDSIATTRNVSENTNIYISNKK